MNDFDVLLKRIRKFDVDKILNKVWRNPRVENFIVDLITQKQLFEKGEDGKGVSLGEYSPFTIQIKVEKGQRVDHITLLDKGEFYESVRVFALSKGFRVEADGDKGEGDNLFDDFGQDITLVSEENLIILSDFIQPFFEMEANKFLSI